MPDLDLSSILLLALALAGAGVVAGLLAGLLGVGGGIVIVPVLFHLFTTLDIGGESRMHLAVGTSLSTIVITSWFSARAHARRGSVDWALLKGWGPFIAVGVVAGAVAAGFVDTATLMLVFAVMALLVALHMAFLRHAAIADSLPRGPARWTIGGLIGFLSTLMGIGGGTLTVPTLTLCRYPIKRAVGTAAAIGMIIAVPGSIGFVIAGLGAEDLPPFSVGYVNLLGLALLSPLTSLFAPIGARLAHAIDDTWLRRAFALFLGITSARMFVAVFG